MSEQLEMSYAVTRAVPRVEELVAYLKGKGWKSAGDISAATGWDDRAIRRIAAASDHLISSPGIEGYKYLFDATLDEYLTYRNGRRSQARKMVAKIIRTDRIYYARPAATAP